MKRYIIVNNNLEYKSINKILNTISPIQTGGIVNNYEFAKSKSKSIDILSYNVCWEAMTSLAIGKFKLCKKDLNGNGNCMQNILLNITNAIKLYKPEIIGIQEAANYKDIIKLFDPNIYDYKINKSGLEHMITTWDKKYFKFIYTYTSEFEPGRPFAIIILKNILLGENYYIINIHAGHNSNTKSSIFDIINNYIETNIEKKLKKNIKRVIILGDFNRNISIDKTSDYIIKINSNNYEMKRFKDDTTTCCSINSLDQKINYDHIIDSKSKLLKKITLNKYDFYKKLSSDHVLIVGKIII